MSNHTVIHESVWTNHPFAEQRLDPFSRLAREVLEIDGVPVGHPFLPPFVLDNHYVYRIPKPRFARQNAFELARNLALHGDRLGSK